MTTLASTLVRELGPTDLEALALRLAPYLPWPSNLVIDDHWLTTAQAANYLAMTADALHKLTAARAIDFEQHAPGCKCYFKRASLDAWRYHQQ